MPSWWTILTSRFLVQMIPEHWPEANCQHHKCNNECNKQDYCYCGSWNVNYINYINHTKVIMVAMMELGCKTHISFVVHITYINIVPWLSTICLDIITNRVVIQYNAGNSLWLHIPWSLCVSSVWITVGNSLKILTKYSCVSTCGQWYYTAFLSNSSSWNKGNGMSFNISLFQTKWTVGSLQGIASKPFDYKNYIEHKLKKLQKIR